MRKILQYEFYVFIGMLMVGGTIAKLFFGATFDSDWFWFIAGFALVFEGLIDLMKQRQFNKKYKVVSKKEFEEMWTKLEVAKK